MDLGEIAYTLQVAREPMEERLAFVVAEPGGTPGGSGAVCRRLVRLEPGFIVAARRKGASTISAESDSRPMCRAASRTDLETVASRWVSGEEIDWRPFYPRTTPRRIPLPGYPFLKKRYWYGSYPDARASAAD